MARSQLDRKRLFRIALAAHGTTADDWAAANKVRGSHLSITLKRGENQKIVALVDDYIAETFRTYKIRVAA